MYEGKRRAHLAVVAVCVCLLAWAVTRLWYANAALPAPSWLAVVLVVAAAAGVVAVALPVRRAVRADPPRPVSRGRAMVALAWGQAAAITGATVAGWNGGYLLTLAPDLDAASVRATAVLAAALVAASIVLSAAGMWAQDSCRIPPDGSAAVA